MFTRKLALSVATAALIAASSLPAKATPGDFRFYFEQTLSPTITGNANAADNFLKGYFTSTATGGGNGNITGFVGTIGGSNTLSTLALSGTYTTTSQNIAQVRNLYWVIDNVSGGSYSNFNWTMFTGNYTSDGSISAAVSWLKNGLFIPLTTQQNIQPLLMPEINGGALPKGLFVIGGVFLMLFGRNRLNEA